MWSLEMAVDYLYHLDNLQLIAATQSQTISAAVKFAEK